MDISPSSDWNSYVFVYDSVLGTIDSSTRASGEGDGQGWDGVLTFSIISVDLTEQRLSTFYWVYQSTNFWLDLTLDYGTYSYFKNLDHDVGGLSDSGRARFATPSEPYIISLANRLDDLGDDYGFTSSLEKAEFVLAFVRAIEYQFDIDGTGQNEYPKYPIEMLWEGAGDCEDAATLYISLVEALGYDAILLSANVKRNAEEDWLGHALPAVHIPNHSGTYYYWTSGSKADVRYYQAEATGGSGGIGEEEWYDFELVAMFDVE